ncbi:hypothetical protein JB92DRAFT_3064215 [Gautieria morchelliformis]|nr:hypothetical protein JB92DRAFT_3064215 [Gautieria morchelliformis]
MLWISTMKRTLRRFLLLALVPPVPPSVLASFPLFRSTTAAVTFLRTPKWMLTWKLVWGLAWLLRGLFPLPPSGHY